MQLTQFSDYSLRVLVYLGLRPGEWITIRSISQAYGISRNHLMKVVSFLVHHDYVLSRRGPGGGIRLRRPPEEINLAEVISKTESDMHLVECFGPQPDCVLTPTCRIRQILAESVTAFMNTLGRHTLEDVLHPREELSKILGVGTAPASRMPASENP